VAQRASLEETRLIVEGRCARSAAEARIRVTLQTQQIQIAQPQHVSVWPTMYQVARFAAIHLHRRMLEYKRTLLVGVASEADSVLRFRCPYLLRTHCSVHVVAIAALNQPFVHSMVKGHRKFGPLRQMAGVAKLRLRFDQKEFLRRCVVRRMTGSAAHSVLRVHRIQRVHVLGAAGVAGQAAVVNFFR